MDLTLALYTAVKTNVPLTRINKRVVYSVHTVQCTSGVHVDMNMNLKLMIGKLFMNLFHGLRF